MDHIIVMNQKEKTGVTSETQLTKEFEELYHTSGSDLDRETFYAENCYWDALNGSLEYQEDKGIIFAYYDHQTEKAYDYIQCCERWIKDTILAFDSYEMFQVLLTLNAVGLISHEEYEILHAYYEDFK